MTLQQKLLNTYGFDIEPILDSIRANANIKWRLEETDNFACILWESEKGLLQDDTPGFYIAFDDMFHPWHFHEVLQELADKFDMKVVPNVTPIAYYSKFDKFEDWRKTVKTAPSYWRGEKFKAQTITQYDMHLEELEHNEHMLKLLEMKQAQFPESTKQTNLAAFWFAAKMDPKHKVVLTVSHVNGELLWGAAFCQTVLDHKTNKVTEWTCPFVSVTTNIDIQRIYKPMLVGHIEVVRRCMLLNAGLHVNFGLYFGYKELLCLNKMWLPGVRTV